MSRQNLLFLIVFWVLLLTAWAGIVFVRWYDLEVGPIANYSLWVILFSSIAGIWLVDRSKKLDAEIKQKREILKKRDA